MIYVDAKGTRYFLNCAGCGESVELTKDEHKRCTAKDSEPICEECSKSLIAQRIYPKDRAG